MISFYSYVSPSKSSFAVIFLILSITSCNYYQEKVLPHVTALNPPESHRIERVAVLKFKNLTDMPGIEPVLRMSLFANLSTKGYTVVRLDKVDHLLKMAEIDSSEIESIDPYQLGRILKVDALFYGTITKCSKVFVGLYSNVAVGAEFKMVDAATSEIIWEADHVEKTHGGGSVSLSPLSIPGSIVDSVLNVRDKVFADTAEKLVKKIIVDIPGNPFVASEDAITVSINRYGDNKILKYVVRPGDTLYKIAEKFYGKGSRWKDIKQVNENLKESNLRIGQEIIVPDIPILDNLDDVALFKDSTAKRIAYKIKWGDSLYKIATALYNNGKRWDIIYENNRNTIKSTTDLPVGQVLILPLEVTQ
ncbi:MAG: GNA1162 family protein [Candidatus Anammoxibacter sp.]